MPKCNGGEKMKAYNSKFWDYIDEMKLAKEIEKEQVKK